MEKLLQRHGGRILAARNFGSHRRLQKKSELLAAGCRSKTSISEPRALEGGPLRLRIPKSKLLTKMCRLA